MSHAHRAPHTRGSVIHWARAYDLLTRIVGNGPQSAARRHTIERAALQPGEKVLDVGCGPGVLSLLAAERVGASGEVHGIDPSPGMIDLAQRKAARAGIRASFRTGVIEALPYEDGTFDAVLSSLMLHHLPDDVKRQGFTEIVRVLKPGGRLLAIDLNGKGFFWRILSLVGHRLPATYAEDLVRMMRDAGLSPQVVDTERTQYVTILATKAA
jgi:demethylmenaquinone methyltransferase/2-methoxy-6-polyprenyl-1,4-benzoquinol methylase/phosphoethanolamine N-methyltransferase